MGGPFQVLFTTQYKNKYREIYFRENIMSDVKAVGSICENINQKLHCQLTNTLKVIIDIGHAKYKWLGIEYKQTVSARLYENFSLKEKLICSYFNADQG